MELNNEQLETIYKALVYTAENENLEVDENLIDFVDVINSTTFRESDVVETLDIVEIIKLELEQKEEIQEYYKEQLED